MSDFIKDTISIDEKLDINLKNVEKQPLKALLLPYYNDPKSLELMVVLKRSLMSGSFQRHGRKLGISALTITLPEDKPITIDEAYAKLNLSAKLQNAIPFGSLMIDPENSTETYEMVMVHIEPPEFLDKKRGIIYQEKGKFEIGAISFSDIMMGIKNNLIADLKTRFMLNELYILATEESQKNNNSAVTVGNPDLIGGGKNLPPGFGTQQDTVRTGDIPDEIIEMNSQKDYGSMYSKVSVGDGFKTITKN